MDTLPTDHAADDGAKKLTIAAFRAELGLSQEAFAALIGLASKGNVSTLERGGPCSLTVALAIERLSEGRISAADINSHVAMARGLRPLPMTTNTAEAA